MKITTTGVKGSNRVTANLVDKDDVALGPFEHRSALRQQLVILKNRGDITGEEFSDLQHEVGGLQQLPIDAIDLESWQQSSEAA